MTKLCLQRPIPEEFALLVDVLFFYNRTYTASQMLQMKQAVNIGEQIWSKYSSMCCLASAEGTEHLEKPPSRSNLETHIMEYSEYGVCGVD